MPRAKLKAFEGVIIRVPWAFESPETEVENLASTASRFSGSINSILTQLNDVRTCASCVPGNFSF